MFNFDPPDLNEFKSNDKQEISQIDPNLLSPNQNNNSSSKPLSSFLNKITQKPSRSKSPFKLLNRLSREPSPMNNPVSTKTQQRNQSNSKQVQNPKTKISRSSEFGMKSTVNPPPNPSSISPGNKSSTSNSNQNTLKSVNNYYPPTSGKNNQAQNFERKSTGLNLDENFAFSDSDSNYPQESDDVELQAIIDYVDEYYYGVRIFPGQDASKVFIGWTTSRFHLLTDKLDKEFEHSLISQCTLINTSSDGSIVSSLVRKECYVLSAAELNQNFLDSDVSSSKKLQIAYF